jgi:hypothetical protein
MPLDSTRRFFTFSPDLPDALTPFFWYGRLDGARNVLKAARRDLKDAEHRQHLDAAMAALDVVCRRLAHECWEQS